MRLRNSHLRPTYSSNESLFTCELHHGGTVCMEESNFGYNGGKKDYFDYVDPDVMSLLEFETMAEELGYSKEISVWCRVCGEKEKSDPKLIISDQDLMVMVDKISQGNRMLECFLEHKSSQVEIENGASDFYDPDNDVEADDIDVTSDKNVLNNTTKYWVVPLETQTQPEIGEEDSDYAPSYVLISGGESDEDTSQRYPEFNATVDITNPQFQVSMIFGSFEEFKKAIKEYAIKQRRNIHFDKNDTLRVKASCKKGCPWKIWVSCMGNGTTNVQVKTYNSSHTCSNEHNIKFLTTKWLVNKYLDIFRADPTWSLSGIQARVRADLYLEISRPKTCTVRSKALKIIAGNEEKQYLKLQYYAAEVRRTNPGSTIIFDLTNKVFKRAYVCMAACKEGFLAGCRPIISLDGCWLKGRYGGQLLSAIAIDSNDCIFPIAYAVVDGETSESWRWFLQLLANDIAIENSHAWTFMSDRQKGLIPTIQALFPASEHRFCVRHMYGNFSDAGHKGKILKDHLWGAAMATYVADHEKWMMEIKSLSPAAFEWLTRKLAAEWTKSYFSTISKCDMLLNNLCESFNKYILDARDKPIITMLEIIRTRLMRRFQMKKDESMKYKGSICPKIQKKLDKWKDEAIKFDDIWNGGTQYQVTGNGSQFVFNIATSSCDCRKWDLTGIPCEHACASMRVNGLMPEDYVNDCYKVETCLKIYCRAINPISGEEMWDKSSVPQVIVPPQANPCKAGRPKKARKKSNVELENDYNRTKLSKKGKKMVCSICHQEGHNKRWHAGSTISEHITPSVAAHNETRKKLAVKKKRVVLSNDSNASLV